MSTKKLLLTASMSLTALCTGSIASASSHTEAPAIARDRAADNTDVYAWRCNSSGTPSLCVVANYDGLQLPEGGPNYGTFSTSALYSLHITHNDAKGIPDLKDYITVDIDFRAGLKNPRNPKFKRTEPDDKAAGPGGGKEIFAQLAGEFDINANVTMTKRAGNKTTRQTLFNNVPVAPPNIGTRTLHFAYGAPGSTYEEFSKKFIHTSGNNYQFFAGPRDDAFYVNLAQVFDLGAFVGLNELNGAPFRSKLYDKPGAAGQFANVDSTKAPDAVAYTNVNTIAFRIPLTELMPDGQLPASTPSNKSLFGVWASASRPAVSIFSVRNGQLNLSTGSLGDDGREYTGAWTQVSRQGLPLINEALVGKQDQDFYNRTTPQNDVKNFGKYILNPVLVRDVEAIGGYAQLGVATVPDDFKYGRTDILDVVNLKNIPTPNAHDVPIENGRTGDVQRVDVSGDSAFPNGRALSGPAVASGKEEDVTDTILLLVLGKLNPAFAGKITDYVGGPGDGRKLLPAFPYMATPWAGDTEGKGSPAKL